MRKQSLVDTLFPKVRQQVLSVLLLDPDRAWYQSDLATRLHLQVSSLQRELASLAESGILRRTRDGNRIYFQADRDCPIFSELQGLLIKTVGLADPVREALSVHAEHIRVAFIYGSFAKGEERSLSDVDLFVVGDLELMELTEALSIAQVKLGRSINPALYATKEFRMKLANGNHFIQAVLNEPKLFIIGSESELAATAGSRQGEAARDNPKGA